MQRWRKLPTHTTSSTLRLSGYRSGYEGHQGNIDLNWTTVVSLTQTGGSLFYDQRFDHRVTIVTPSHERRPDNGSLPLRFRELPRQLFDYAYGKGVA